MGLRTARQVMKRDIMAAAEDWPVDRLAEFLIENHISGAPVNDQDGKLVGVVSLTDLVRHRTIPVSEVRDAHDYYQGLTRHFSREEIASFRFGADDMVTVREIMTPMIFEVSEDTSVKDVADAMIRGRIHRVFVTREGVAVGIITALDLLEVVREM